MVATASGSGEANFAEQLQPKREDCSFYHTIELPGHGVIDASAKWDLRDRFQEYIGGVDVRGKSILDVGTASGFLSFEAEKHGAGEVIGFDADDASRINYVPYANKVIQPSDFFPRMKNSWWFSRNALSSRAKAIYGDIYKMSDFVPQMDIVVIGQILVHLERPITVISEAAKVAKDTLIIAEGSFEDERPLSVFIGGSDLYYNWYHMSVGFYREVLEIVGFKLVSVTKSTYTCHAADVAPQTQVYTFVAKRA